ncbi:MAG: GNAT family N-acetyltransferase [Ktedonobacterales bacterium]
MQPAERQSETSESPRAQQSAVPAQRLDTPVKRPGIADTEQPDSTLIPDDARHLEGALVLRDGSRIHMRPIRADDSARLQVFHAGLSPETIVFRFFHFVPKLAQEAADHFTHVDYANSTALVATIETAPEEQIVGVVRYERTGPSNAEVAFMVADPWQGHGIATALLRYCASLQATRDNTTSKPSQR